MMHSETSPIFTPPHQPGTAVQLAAAGVLAAGAGVCYYLAAQPGRGGLAFLLLGLLLTAPLPLLLYGAYALQRAAYAVSRDRLVLQWGWWVEEVPLRAVVWVQAAEALETPLPLPRLRWPGNLTGERQAGEVRFTFMAAQPQGLVVIATDDARRFVISPAEPGAFLEAVRRAAEEGSLETVAPASHRPTRWLNAIWRDAFARALLLAAWGATLAAVVWSSLATSNLAGGSSPAADDRAVLLAAAAVLFQGLDAGLGLFAYQSPARRGMAYLIWVVGAAAALGFLASVGVVLLGGAG